VDVPVYTSNKIPTTIRPVAFLQLNVNQNMKNKLSRKV